MSKEIIELKNEGGKKLTVNAAGGGVAMIVWRKNDAVLLPLQLTRLEALALVRLINTAMEEAKS